MLCSNLFSCQVSSLDGEMLLRDQKQRNPICYSWITHVSWA